MILATGNTFVTPTLSAGTYSYYAQAISCLPSANRTLITFTVSVCTSLLDQKENSFNLIVYPNPVTSELTIRATNSLINSKVQIMNAIGSIIYSNTISNDTTTVNTSEFSSGVYVIQISNTNNTQILKFIKQ